jgi:hypothetical protein
MCPDKIHYVRLLCAITLYVITLRVSIACEYSACLLHVITRFYTSEICIVNHLKGSTETNEYR